MDRTLRVNRVLTALIDAGLEVAEDLGPGEIFLSDYRDGDTEWIDVTVRLGRDDEDDTVDEDEAAYWREVMS